MPLPKKLLVGGQQDYPGANGDMGNGRRGSTSSLEPKKVMANRYQMEGKLGSGAFGTAFLVLDLKSNNEKKVLKQIPVADMQPDDTVDAVREARLLAKLDHPSIVKFQDSFMEKECFCIVTENCEGGDLDAKIQLWKQGGRRFDESLIIDWFIQLTTAIKYIHDRRVLHRDLKARNIFLKNNLIKLGDFGISRILMGTSDLATTFTGTPYYMSPEVLKHDGYNVKSDIWSLGCVLYELCTLEHAFQGQNLMAVMYKIVEGDQPRLPDHFNTQLAHIFSRMLDKDPNSRPTAVDVLQEPFIQQCMENLRGRMSMKGGSMTKLAAEADAIAKALSPVKLKQLVTDDSQLTPRQRMEQRKKKRADEEAEKRKRAAAQNFSEIQQRRERERKKQHVRVIPPWVEEHPDVFNDSNFSITQPATESSMYFDPVPMEMSVEPMEEIIAEPQRMAWGSPKRELPPQPSDPPADMSIEHKDEVPDGQRVVIMSQPSEEIPEDPLLAETHYSQYEDFESSDDEYEAFLECIEDALNLPNHPSPVPVVPPEDPHESVSPFTPLAREKKIQLLRSECIHIFGAQDFHKLYECLVKARYTDRVEDELVIMAQLREIVPNIRDCFLVDQLVFLEKQTESL
ncbi:serine/threonine-protein kinase Nek11-like [Halichondria panicea]|uniref:serine/threonine-protein kinase Nek11-like n=1 Tax=Halichondria panicea TaxID=6063 RepID=UPI00312B2D36